MVAAHLQTGWYVVLRLREVHQLTRDVEEQGGVHGSSVHGDAAHGLVLRPRDGEDIHRPHSCAVGAKGAQGLLVGVLAVGRQNDELLDPTLLPRTYQIVEESVEGLASDGRATRKGRRRGGIHAIFYRRGPEDVEFRREIIGHALDDECVATQGQMWSMLLRCSDGDDEPCVPLQVGEHRIWSEVLE